MEKKTLLELFRYDGNNWAGNMCQAALVLTTVL